MESENVYIVLLYKTIFIDFQYCTTGLLYSF